MQVLLRLRTVMDGWWHGVCVSACWFVPLDWLFVFPLCGFSLSLFCNYFNKTIQEKRITPLLSTCVCSNSKIWKPACGGLGSDICIVCRNSGRLVGACRPSSSPLSASLDEGLQRCKAAVPWARRHYPTSVVFLAGARRLGLSPCNAIQRIDRYEVDLRRRRHAVAAVLALEY